MMEENFPAGVDALVYLAKPIKNIPQNYFEAIHLVRTYLMTGFSTPLPLYALVHIFETPSIPLVRTYLMDRLFLNQKTNKNIRISHSPKYKYSKKLMNK